MGYRGGKGNKNGSDVPKLLWLDLIGWLFVLVSLVISGAIDIVVFDVMKTTAQKMANPEAFMGILLLAIFVGSGVTIFAILNALRKRIGW